MQWPSLFCGRSRAPLERFGQGTGFRRWNDDHRRNMIGGAIAAGSDGLASGGGGAFRPAKRASTSLGRAAASFRSSSMRPICPACAALPRIWQRTSAVSQARRPDLCPIRRSLPRAVLSSSARSGSSPLIDRLAASRQARRRRHPGQMGSVRRPDDRQPLARRRRSAGHRGQRQARRDLWGLRSVTQIGVSPWYWWADVPVVRQDHLRVATGRYVQGPPAVKYRGIFLNDEAPCLSRLDHREIRRDELAVLRRAVRTAAAPARQLSVAGDVEQRLCDGRSGQCAAGATNTASSWAPRTTSR